MSRLFASCFVLGSVLLSLEAGGNNPKEPKNWTPVQIAGKQKMPEFEDIAEWVNSPPLTAKELKGKVVVVHFMAFG